MPLAGSEKFDVTRREAYLQLLREGQRRCLAARMVGVHPWTVSQYRRRHPNWEKEAVLAEMEANEVVENALFLSAIQGNVSAAQFWLTNRDPDNWSDRKTVKSEVSGPDGGPIAVENSSYVRAVLSDQRATELALELLDQVAELEP